MATTTSSLGAASSTPPAIMNNYPTTTTSASSWLSLLGLDQYSSSFVKKGFDDVSLLPFLNNEDLDEIGILLPGHRKKLLLAAAALRGVQRLETPEASQIENERLNPPEETSTNDDASESAPSTSLDEKETEDKEGITCYFCHQPGHYQNECPKKIAAKGCYVCGKLGHEARYCTKNNRNHHAEMECYSCQRFGHVARNCPFSSSTKRGGGYRGSSSDRTGEDRGEYRRGGGDRRGRGGRGSYSSYSSSSSTTQSYRYPKSFNSREKKNGTSPYGCYRCGEEGHRSSECSQKDCYNCHELGHIASECPTNNHNNDD